MKKNIFLLLSFVCLACFVGCKPSYLHNATDIKKLSFVDAYIMSSDDDCEDDFECENIQSIFTPIQSCDDCENDDIPASKTAKCIFDDDSLSTFIAYNFQYPYDQIGDSVEFICKVFFDINANGCVSKVESVDVNDWDEVLPVAKRKQIVPELKKEAIRIAKQLKFKSQSMKYNTKTGKWIVDTKPVGLYFKITPYPVEKVNDKDLVIYYLSQSHVVNGRGIGISGGKTVEYVLQEKFKAMTTAEEKENFILYGKSPVLKYLSFEYFVEKKSPKCISFINKALADTAVIGANSGCNSYGQLIPDAMIYRFYRDGRFCSVKDSMKLDSLIFFSHKVKDLDYKYYLIDRLKPTPERYIRARELYHKDKFNHALALIARYRNPQDKPFFFEALQYYIDENERLRNSETHWTQKKEVKIDRNNPRHYTLNRTRDLEAYDAVTYYWHDKDFVPYLKRIDAN